MTVHRRYRYCPHCQKNCFPIDAAAGIDQGYTVGIRRLIARSCGLWSYRLASENLQEFCGISLSHTLLGTLAEQIAEEIEESLQHNPEIKKSFQHAEGDTEFYADGAFIHIRDASGQAQWNEMKIGVLAKRVQGESALPADWDNRTLPEPSAVSAFAVLGDKELFQERCQAERRRLGVGGVSSALADGAKWIWHVVEEVFGKTEECLDIFHTLEHISDCGKELYGVAEESTAWFEEMRLVLLSEGFDGMERELLKLRKGLKTKRRKSVDLLLRYLEGNKNRLNYCERLREGRVIGSGMVEGACKNLVGRRLKQTGACWRVDRVNKIAILAAAIYSKQWNALWKNTY